MDAFSIRHLALYFKRFCSFLFLIAPSQRACASAMKRERNARGRTNIPQITTDIKNKRKNEYARQSNDKRAARKLFV